MKIGNIIYIPKIKKNSQFAFCPKDRRIEEAKEQKTEAVLRINLQSVLFPLFGIIK